MFASSLVLLSFTLGCPAAGHAAAGSLSPRSYGAARDAAVQAHDGALAAIDNREAHIMNAYHQQLQQATQQNDAERTRSADRIADLRAQQAREVAAILVQRNEAHARLRDAGLYVALPSADPAVAIVAIPAVPAVIAPGCPLPAVPAVPGAADALAERNAEHARLEAERFENEIAREGRMLQAVDAEYLRLTQFYGQEMRQRLEELARDRAVRVEAKDRALAILGSRSRLYATEQARADADARIAAQAARVAEPAPGRAAADALLAALR